MKKKYWYWLIATAVLTFVVILGVAAVFYFKFSTGRIYHKEHFFDRDFSHHHHQKKGERLLDKEKFEKKLSRSLKKFFQRGDFADEQKIPLESLAQSRHLAATGLYAIALVHAENENISRAELEGLIPTIFGLVDTDKDGYIQRSEMRVWVRTNIFQLMDKNQNGLVEKQEFIEYETVNGEKGSFRSKNIKD